MSDLQVALIALGMLGVLVIPTVIFDLHERFRKKNGK